MNPIDKSVLEHLDVHVALDNQSTHPQDAIDPAPAAAPPALHNALHADLQLLAQPRRSVLAELATKWR